MRKLGTGIALMTGVALMLTGPVWSGSKDGKKKDELKEKVEMATTAKISIDQAIKSASEKAPGKVIEAELEKKHGKTVWEVEMLTTDGKIIEVHVDADSGSVIDTEDKKPEKKK